MKSKKKSRKVKEESLCEEDMLHWGKGWDRLAAQLSMKKKLQIVVLFQEIAMMVNPKFRKEWRGILPWGSHKR